MEEEEEEEEEDKKEDVEAVEWEEVDKDLLDKDKEVDGKGRDSSSRVRPVAYSYELVVRACHMALALLVALAAHVVVVSASYQLSQVVWVNLALKTVVASDCFGIATPSKQNWPIAEIGETRTGLDFFYNYNKAFSRSYYISEKLR